MVSCLHALANGEWIFVAMVNGAENKACWSADDLSR